MPPSNRRDNHREIPVVALVGASGYAQTHLRFLRECEERNECRLESAVAVPGTPPQDIAELNYATERRVRLYSTFEEWCDAEAGQFDLCFIPTPVHLHARMAQAALRAGGSVLVEKPLSSSWSDIEKLVRVQPEAERYLAVGFQDLYLPEVHALKRALLEGNYGCLRRIKVLGLWPRSNAYYERNDWAGRLQTKHGLVLDSPVSNALAHFVMLALFFASNELETATVVVAGEAELYRSRNIESFDTVAARLATKTGVEIMCFMTHSGQRDESPCIVMETDSARIEWRAWQDLRVTGRGGYQYSPLPDMWATRRTMCRTLCRRSRGHPAYICSPAVAASHAALILDLYESCKIMDVPQKFIQCDSQMQGVKSSLVNVDSVLVRSFESFRLPSEIGGQWTQPPSSVTGGHGHRLAALISALPTNR